MLHNLLTHLFEVLPFVPLLGLMNWWELSNGDTSNDHFNAGDWSAFGIAAPGSMMPNRAQFTTLNQVAGFENNPNSPNYGQPLFNAFGTAGQATYRFTPHSGRMGGGGSGGSGSGGGGSSSSGQPIHSNGFEGGSVSQGGWPSSGTVSYGPTAGSTAAGTAAGSTATTAGTTAGTTATTATTANTAAAAPWWKTVLGNKALMSGAITAVGSIYGQYDQKKQAKNAYKWQQGELAAQRAYAEEQLARRQNSPVARMTPALMQMAVQIFGQRLRNRGYGNLLDIMMGQIPPGGA